eukprot:9024191-Karenia_brevis.AAC.1
MLKKTGRTPKLGAQAAPVRALVPFAKEMMERLVDATDPVSLTIAAHVGHLAACYDCLYDDS